MITLTTVTIKTCTANPASFLDGVTIGVIASVVLAFIAIRKFNK